jgi:hypothetical protein
VELKFAGVLARRNLHAKVKDFEPLTMAEKSNGLAGAELRCECPQRVESGPLVFRHADNAARSLCPTSLPRNGGSS